MKSGRSDRGGGKAEGRPRGARAWGVVVAAALLGAGCIQFVPQRGMGPTSPQGYIPPEEIQIGTYGPSQELRLFVGAWVVGGSGFQKVELALQGEGVSAEPVQMNLWRAEGGPRGTWRCMGFGFDNRSPGYDTLKDCSFPLKETKKGHYKLTIKADGSPLVTREFDMVEIPGAQALTAVGVDPVPQAYRLSFMRQGLTVWVPVDVYRNIRAYSLVWFTNDKLTRTISAWMEGSIFVPHFAKKDTLVPALIINSNTESVSELLLDEGEATYRLVLVVDGEKVAGTWEFKATRLPQVSNASRWEVSGFDFLVPTESPLMGYPTPGAKLPQALVDQAKEKAADQFKSMQVYKQIGDPVPHRKPYKKLPEEVICAAMKKHEVYAELIWLDGLKSERLISAASFADAEEILDSRFARPSERVAAAELRERAIQNTELNEPKIQRSLKRLAASGALYKPGCFAKLFPERLRPLVE